MNSNYVERSSVWIVVPAFNEGRVIRPVVSRLLESFPNVVVIDDGSEDNTAQGALIEGAVVLRHPVNLGQGAAIQTGLLFAVKSNSKYVATFDADGQHQVSDLENMLECIAESAVDIVLGSRFLGSAPNIPFFRRIALKLAILFTTLTSRVRLTDTHNGLRLMRADTARRLCIRQNRMSHASEIINQISELEVKYKEIPITITYTNYSLEKGQKWKDIFSILGEITTGWLSK